MSKAFLVLGATGKQGGAVVRSLIRQPGFSPTTHTIYGLTRDIFSNSAKKLAALSPAVKPVQGNMKDPAGVFAQLDPKPAGVFVVHAMNGDETAESNGIVDEAVRQGVRHIVYSGVDRGGDDSDHDPTDIPHFITKHHIELHIKELAAADPGLVYTILRPVFFLDNLRDGGMLTKVSATAWRDTVVDRKLQVVDTADIGDFAALAFMDPDDARFRNRAISLAGDELSFGEADAIWRAKLGTGIPTTFGVVRWGLLAAVKELGYMFRWFNNVGYHTDIPALNKIKPMTTFEQWVQREMVKN